MRNSKLVLLLGLTTLTLGCSRSEPVAVVQAAQASPSPASTEPSPFYETSGPLVVENQVDVLSQREGVVARLLADVNTRVRKGQVLAELDNRQLQADRDAAEAKAKSLQFELQHWLAEVKVREADLARDEEMFKGQMITAKQLDHSRYSVEGGRFEVERERQAIKSAQETLRSLELEQEKSRIAAPFDGVVARRYVRAGQRVMANDRLFWVTALAPISVRFTVPQEMAGKLRAGAEVQVASQAAPDRGYPARVTVVSPVVDPSSGTLEVQAQLAQPSPDLLPGMTVSIRVKR